MHGYCPPQECRRCLLERRSGSDRGTAGEVGDPSPTKHLEAAEAAPSSPAYGDRSPLVVALEVGLVVTLVVGSG